MLLFIVLRKWGVHISWVISALTCFFAALASGLERTLLSTMEGDTAVNGFCFGSICNMHFSFHFLRIYSFVLLQVYTSLFENALSLSAHEHINIQTIMIQKFRIAS